MSGQPDGSGRLDPSGADRLQRRTLIVLVAAQVMGGAGFFVGITVMVLLALELSGSDALSGLPPALGIAASALAAAPISSWMSDRGRRPGLAAGHLCAMVGCLVVLAAAALESFALLCLGAAAFGVGNTSNLLARYAAADLSPLAARGRAISVVLLATTLGAVAGPNLAALTEPLGTGLGMSRLAGAFVVAAAAYLLAALILLALLRPDPLLAARAMGLGAAAPEVAEGESVPALSGGFARPAWTPLALTALATLVAVNVAMVALMTMTPLHLDHAGQSLQVVGVVISLHVAAMFLPSPLTGWLTDRIGRLPVIGAAAGTLIAAGAVAAVAPGHQEHMVAIALILLGLAWNLGLVSGSALLIDQVAPTRRVHAQGRADLAMGLVGAAASLGSGALLEVGGFVLLAGIAAGLGVGLAGVAMRSARLAAA